LPDAPVYGSNNWYYAYGNSSAEEILEDTVLLAELTEGIENRPFMVIDDCWQELALTKGAAGRPYERGNVRFPDMELLASKIKAANIRPGIWIRPLETNEMFLSKELRALRHRNALDPSVPEVLELIGEDIRRVTSWGYELVKYDFATFDFYGDFYPEGKEVLKQKGWTLHNRSMTSAECIKALYKTLHDNANGAVLIGCNVIGHLAAGLIHLHRSGDDTSGNSFDRTVMMGVNTLAFRLPQHKAFFDIDADCVGITENIPWEYNKRFLDLLANSGTPLFISAKPSAMTQEMKKDLNAAFQKAALQKNQMEPLDWFETTLPEKYCVDGEIKQYKWIESSGLNSFCSL
jgi:alpha-galactosidase